MNYSKKSFAKRAERAERAKRTKLKNFIKTFFIAVLIIVVASSVAWGITSNVTKTVFLAYASILLGADIHVYFTKKKKTPDGDREVDNIIIETQLLNLAAFACDYGGRILFDISNDAITAVGYAAMLGLCLQSLLIQYISHKEKFPNK